MEVRHQAVKCNLHKLENSCTGWNIRLSSADLFIKLTDSTQHERNEQILISAKQKKDWLFTFRLVTTGRLKFGSLYQFHVGTRFCSQFVPFLLV